MTTVLHEAALDYHRRKLPITLARVSTCWAAHDK